MPYNPIGADENGNLPPAVRAKLEQTYVPLWQPNTAYTAGARVVSPSGDLVTAKVNFTSGASFSSSNWNLSAAYAPQQETYRQLARTPDMLIAGAITRDANGAATSAPVVWPDGSAGTYTGTPSATFPGAIDSYTITYGSPVTKTYTQPAVTRNADGAATAVPAIVVS